MRKKCPHSDTFHCYQQVKTLARRETAPMACVYQLGYNCGGYFIGDTKTTCFSSIDKAPRKQQVCKIGNIRCHSTHKILS